MARTKSQIAAQKKRDKQREAAEEEARVAEEEARLEEEERAEEAAKINNRSKNKNKRGANDDDSDEYEDEYEDEEDEEIDENCDAELKKRLSELKKREKILKMREKELKQKEDLKAKPAKKGRKKADAEDEEKVDVISIQYRIDAGRPNFELNGTFATAILDDLIGFDVEFTKQDVSIFFNHTIRILFIYLILLKVEKRF
jgi:hypothetical protein